MDIPLPDQILRLRSRQTHAPLWERMALQVWSRRWAFRLLMGLGALASPVLRRVPLPTRHRWRSVPRIPWRTARERIRGRAAGAAIAETDASGRDVDLFLQCLTDTLLPDAGDGCARLLEAAGAKVHVPAGQHCCGLPAFDAGDWETARRMARQSIEALESRGQRDIVTPAASCQVAIQRQWPELFADDPAWLKRAQAVAGRTHDLAEYLETTARLPDGALAGGADGTYAVHRFCQATNLLGQGDVVSRLVARLTGAEGEELAEATTCCGFGGLTSITAPEVGRGILERKLDCVRESGAGTLITNNPGCVLHLGAGAEAAGLAHETRHYAEYLADRLPTER